MKSKIILTLAISLLLSLSADAQFKVDQYGRIGMGTNYPNPGYKCHIKGNLLLTTYPALPWVEFQFKTGNFTYGPQIGTNVDMVSFYSPYVNYHVVYAQKYLRLSDAGFKTNLKPIASPLSKVLLLKPYAYDFRDDYISEEGDSLTRAIPEYGFISQEVEEVLPEVKITENGVDGKLMDYDQIIPLLVAGMQEQQKQISALEAQMARIIATRPADENNDGGSGNSDGLMDDNKLFGNVPNPLTNTTEIPYFLAENTTSAQIKVWDMNGVERKSFNLSPQGGDGRITLNSADLPVSGTYVYALIVNGRIVNAKTMVCNK